MRGTGLLLAALAAIPCLPARAGALTPGLLETLSRIPDTPVRIEIFEGAHHVLPASVPLEELVGRIDHWFTASEGTLEPRFVVQRVSQAELETQAMKGG